MSRTGQAPRCARGPALERRTAGRQPDPARTVIVAEAAALPYTATMLAVPARRAVTSPLASTDAMLGLVLAQLTLP